jgi:hypothetical protein
MYFILALSQSEFSMNNCNNVNFIYFWLLVLFSVLFVNCGDNIKVYFSIVTHEIPLRVMKKTTSDSMHNQVGSKSPPKFKFFKKEKKTRVSYIYLHKFYKL